MHQLTKLALRRPISILMIVIALLVFGASSVLATPLELIPDIEMPILIVMTPYPGAAPEDVDNLVTAPILDAASTISGVKTVQSTSSENVSLIVLQMEYGTDMDKAHTSLQNNINLFKSRLPDDAGTPTVIEMSMDMMPAIVLSATAKGDIDPLYYVEEEIKPQFVKLSGVASVEISGGQRDYISVRIKEDALAAYKITMDTIVSATKNADFSLPAGSIAQGELALVLRGGISYPTSESLRSIPLTLASGDIIHLSDVADIIETTREKSSISRLNGKENISISVSKVQSASTFAVTRAVKDTVKELQAANNGLEFQIVYDTSDMIWGAIVSVLQTMALGVIFAMTILFLFFGDWRASLIVGTSIPLSMLVTLIAMSFMGFSFNILSLGGLVIGAGMMVDNSIVVLESCFRTRSDGKGYLEAILEGTRVITSSIVASTLTTVVVFLPIALLKGMSGQLFGQLGFTIVFSLTASLISALTVVPLLFYRLEPKERTKSPASKPMARLERRYERFLPTALRYKKTVVLVSVLLLVGSFALIPFIGVELMPANDEGTITLDVTTRPGLSLKRINELLSPLETMVREHPDLDRYSLTSGGGGMRSMSGGASSSATITAYLRDDRKNSTAEVMDDWRSQVANFLDGEIQISASSTTLAMAGNPADLELNLQSTGLDDMRTSAVVIEEFLRTQPEVLNVQSTVTSGNPQAEIIIDPVKATAAGLLPSQIMGSVYTMMEGSKAATLHQSGRDYDIVVEYPPERFADLSDLNGMFINSPRGHSVALLDVATIEYTYSPQSIARKDGRYLVSITAQLSSSAPDNTSEDIIKQAKMMDLPAGIEFTESAQSESQTEEFTALFWAIATAVFLVFLTMAIQFESPRFSIVVMICIPFALIGSFSLLMLFRATLSMPSLMGFLMLVGIVVNNGILFIDTANMLRLEQGLSADEALTKAGMLRMRPIFMTTLTTMLAMVPMAIGLGDNGEIMRGMALVIIGGLFASTTLTLLLLPSFYLIFYRKKPMRSDKTKLAAQKTIRMQ